MHFYALNIHLGSSIVELIKPSSQAKQALRTCFLF